MSQAKEWTCKDCNMIIRQNFCGDCGKPRPKDTDELDRMLKDLKEVSPKFNFECLKSDLLAWRDKAVKEAMDKHSCHVEQVKELRKEWDNPSKPASSCKEASTKIRISCPDNKPGCDAIHEKKAITLEDVMNIVTNDKEMSYRQAAEAVKALLREKMPEEMGASDLSMMARGWNQCRAEMLKLLEEI